MGRKKKREINKILIANRGVTAVRIMHTCRDRKIPTTAVYSTPDRLAHHVFMADTALHIGEAPPAESYLNMEKMVAAAIQSKADAIHPGWGFLAENADRIHRHLAPVNHQHQPIRLAQPTSRRDFD